MNLYIEHLWQRNKPSFNKLGLESLEKKYGILFPQEFIDFFSKNFGSMPFKKHISTGIGDDVAGFFLHVQDLSITNENRVFDIRYQVEKIREQSSEKLIPFMITENLNFVCFCFENSSNDPDVILLLTDLLDLGYERATRFVSENFVFFLEDLAK